MNSNARETDGVLWYLIFLFALKPKNKFRHRLVKKIDCVALFNSLFSNTNNVLPNWRCVVHTVYTQKWRKHKPTAFMYSSNWFLYCVNGWKNCLHFAIIQSQNELWRSLWCVAKISYINTGRWIRKSWWLVLDCVSRQNEDFIHRYPNLHCSVTGL